MRESIAPKPAKLPFFVADLFLVSTAVFVFYQSPRPLPVWALSLVVICALAAAWFAVLPFILEFRSVSRLAETEALTEVAAQVQQMEAVAEQIGSATAQWQTVQEAAAKTSGEARAIAERMAGEVKAFNEFMERANNTEKVTLRLEVDKLRRAEGEWLQVLVGVMDHVYALYRGAVKSGQRSVAEQVSGFQNACREVTRRVGLAPFVAKPQEAFTPDRHQFVEGNEKATAGSMVGETLATGYTYQGRMVRPALVSLVAAGAEPVGTASDTDAAPRQDQLPLGNA